MKGNMPMPCNKSIDINFQNDDSSDEDIFANI